MWSHWMFNITYNLLNTRFKIQDPIPIEKLFQSEEITVNLSLSKVFCYRIGFGILSLAVSLNENFPADRSFPIDDHTLLQF